MSKKLLLAMSFAAVAMFAAEDVVTAVEGTVKKVDAGTKTVVVATADGTEHTLHVVKKTAVHGWDATEAGAKDGMHGVKEGSHVVVHYTVKGADKTAQEMDRIGEGGLKVTEGTVSKIDRGGKVLAVKTADGVEATYKITDHAVEDAGKDIGKGVEKASKVTVYYTEEGGKKVVHFFKNN
jgi:ABC-type Fe3+-hydroxamate transport system substrate-binding protein